MAALKGQGATYQQLQLGSVTFFKFEVPEELPGLFGVQKLAIHDMPGGTRLVQQLGAFPFEHIEWKGIFFLGDTQNGSSSPIDRASQLNTYRVTAQPQMLIWGPFQLQVIVHEFEVVGRLAQELQYRIKVVPLIDQTTTSNQAPSQPSFTQAMFDANQGLSNAASAPIVSTLPAPVMFAIAQVQGAVTAAIIKGSPNGQTLSSASTVALQSQIAATQALLTPYVNGSNYQQSAAAINLSTQLATMNNLLNQGTVAQQTTITATNPNLMTLATQYYGDASLWPLIAQANNLQDFLPIGTFSLVIPPAAAQSQFIPS